MSLSSWDAQNKCLKGECDDEIILTLVPATEEITTKLPSESISSTVDHGPPVPPMAPSEEDIKPSTQKLKPHSPLPEILPPITEVSRNTLRTWCRHQNLSTDGKKVEVYLRLQEKAYSEQKCYIPQTSLEAKMKPKLKKAKKGTANTTIKKPMSQNIKREREENSIVEVITSERESAFAAWGRIATRSGLPRGANCQPLPSNVKSFLPPSPGYRWCVVHGRLLPADKTGWVCLQMSIGHTWVPDSPQRMVCLFLLPACVFPTPGVEDNLLCPECVKSNKRIMRNFTRDRYSTRNPKRLPPNLPP